MGNTQLETYLAEEIRKLREVSYPQKAGFLRRLFIRSAALSKLHPNPNDEFCSPEIGPCYEIISRYVEDYRPIKSHPKEMKYLRGPAGEKLQVEKIYPDGYMILNGHHRWGAAWMVGLEKLPVKIVDLTQQSDIQKMLSASGFTRRVTLDLDEVVFRSPDDPLLEKPLPFPLRKIYRERLRRGIPALFSTLSRSGYDIWIYTSGYYSLEYLRHYFKYYHVPVTGIVTGIGRKEPSGADIRKELEKLMNTRYQSTVHIDQHTVIRVFSGSGTFDEFNLSGSPETWTSEVKDIIPKLEKTCRNQT